MKCFRCKGTGHKARDCKSTAAREPKSPMSLSARVREAKCSNVRTKYGQLHGKSSPRIVGKRSTIDVKVLGRDRKALLDTGSEVSILPSRVLKEAMSDGIDIDAVVKEIPVPKSLKITDASGRVMNFLTAVDIDVADKSDNKHSLVRMLVSRSEEDLIILGTNAISRMGYEVRKISCEKEDRTMERQQGSEECPAAVVARRVFIAPGETKDVDLTCRRQWSEAILHTKDGRIPDGLCEVSANGIAKVTVVNTTQEPMVIQKGQEVGEWENAYWERYSL
ncbi:zinc knuckle [Cooperia oncophora]